MYERDQKMIADFARIGPKALARVALFATLSARQPFIRMAPIMRDVDKLGAKSAHAWSGHKADAVAFWSDPTRAQAAYDALYWLEACAPGGQWLASEALYYLAAEVPGLGMAKGGFVLQMVFGLGGCIDVNNLALYDIPPRLACLRADWPSHILRKRCAEYIELCARFGTPASLWDQWCEYVGARDGISADRVSRDHSRIICRA